MRLPRPATVSALGGSFGSPSGSVIPREARNVAEAYAFIDYLQRPEIAARNTNYLSYANGNRASWKFIDKSVLDDKTIYPDEATMQRLYTINARDPKTERLMNRLWTRIKTGR